MPVTSTLKRQVDLPLFEWCRFAPAVSGALSAATSAYNSNYNPIHGRYIYYLINATNFWRYDTWADTYLQLTTPPLTVATWSALQFTSNGYEGRTISSTSNTITLAGYCGQAMKGYDIQIVSGTGAGQRRLVTSVADTVPAALSNGQFTGVATAFVNTQGASTITDSLQNWAVNQWVGYQVRIVYGTGISQIRKILYNSATVLTLADSTKMADDILANPALFNPTLSATAGSQSIYAIESSTATVDQPWTINPDSTSRFRIDSGTVYLVSSAAATPFYSLQVYDIMTDTWYVKTSNTAIMAAIGAEGSIENADEAANVWVRSTATSGTTGSGVTVLTDTSQQWLVNEWEGYPIWIFDGTGAGQFNGSIISNTINTLTVPSSSFPVPPNSTSNYFIFGYDGGQGPTVSSTTSGASGTLTDTSQTWTPNFWANYAVRIVAGTGIGQILPIASNTSNTLVVYRGWTILPDTTSAYAIVTNEDKFFISMSGNANVMLYNSEIDTATLGREIDGGTVSIGAATTQLNNAFPLGQYRPQAITSISQSSTTATVTMANSHNFQTGQTVKIIGPTGATAPDYTGQFTITTVPTTTTFTYTMSAAPGSNATLGTALSTTNLTDVNKNWVTNQFVNCLVTFNTVSPIAATGVATTVTAVITANTANTLTMATTTIPINGASRYVITTGHIIGTNSANEFGFATSGSVSTIVDTTKNWVTNLYAGRYVKFTGGSGQAQQGLISANTATTLTFGAVGTAAAANTGYAILQQNLRGTGANLLLAYNATVYVVNPSVTVYPAQPNARYMYIARGGATFGFDRIDTTTDMIESITQSPQIETLTTGSMYAYDGGDRIYFSKIDATTIQHRLYYIDVQTLHEHGAGMVPYVVPTGIVGNRMEIFSTVDGLNYLWLNRGTFQECFRQLLFY